jgi:pilus assembly protein CpaD
MRTIRTLINGRRSNAVVVLRAAIVAGYGLLVCGCQTDQSQQQLAGLPSSPYDYRQRHPITVTEAERTMQLFIGANRASLTPTQRAEVMAFAHTWKSEATGGVLIDLPAGTVNEQASVGAMHEIQSILAANGVPPNGMMVRTYQAGSRSFATVRITYPKITAQAGPCGLWPQDMGPSENAESFENQQYWNFGCSAQHNLAAMVENPEDLVQPRSETPTYTMRRTQVVEKYRQGEPTASQYTNTNAGKISDLGQ